MILRLPKSIIVSFKDFYKDEGIYLSAALAFFSILSIIPLSMFIVNILITFTKEETIVRFVYNKLVYLFPSIEIQMMTEIKKLLMLKGVSEISILLYGFFSLQLFTAIEFSLNKIFKISKQRNILVSFLMSFFIILIIIVAVAASFGISYIIKLIRPPMIEELSTIMRFFVKYVITFLLVFVIIGCLYKFLPKKKIKTVPILIGTLITTILIEFAKYIFAFYVSNIIKISTLYGSVSTFLALLMWLFYAWAVFLYGAELINNLDRKK
ncbi:MAG: YihY/virulence factor BrkB family protein [Thermodesulfovibrio sp.]|uniref:YihY/virulence factor BrkB family protein n=1 Tax=unclassified Thermodesulfovibrio TaxID=2645936 RepID=UPI000839EB98|nr:MULTISPECIES: YihY/virulence factor BrkB family protein [unclassified Thermodesulfovibrio]MDI1472596.1 YihY/virulence factor BrkB family protein [Thermodesulfovibrio sp. 1176]MDI6714357.1 YihY/virulence factor BrkB family protein [Thermodesulfovibrio sp.]ODA44399.1 Ribonuclease BN [Thermodesulfovibrio sp. N1]